MVHLDLEDERTILSVADQLCKTLPSDLCLRMGFFRGVLLNPGKQPGDLSPPTIQ